MLVGMAVGGVGLISLGLVIPAVLPGHGGSPDADGLLVWTGGHRRLGPGADEREQDRVGAATGISETSFELGNALGIAIVGSLVSLLYLFSTGSPANLTAAGDRGGLTTAMSGATIICGVLVLATAFVVARAVREQAVVAAADTAPVTGRRLPDPPSERRQVRQWVDSHLGDLCVPVPSGAAEDADGLTSPRIRGGQHAADAAMQAFDVGGYARRRNNVWPPADRGASGLSPYIRHGLLTLREVWDHVAGGPPVGCDEVPRRTAVAGICPASLCAHGNGVAERRCGSSSRSARPQDLARQQPGRSVDLIGAVHRVVVE